MKAAVLAAGTMLAACGAGGFSLEKAEVDRSLVTSKVPTEPDGVKDSGRLSDEMTIRNAVSSADLEGLQGQAIAWANADTGSRGSITDVVESKERGVTCRLFTVSRESFDGVSLFRGEICTAGAGAWRMLAFNAV